MSVFYVLCVICRPQHFIQIRIQTCKTQAALRAYWPNARQFLFSSTIKCPVSPHVSPSVAFWVSAVKIINNFSAMYQHRAFQRHSFKHVAMAQQDRRMLKGNQHNQGFAGQPIIGTGANASAASEVGCARYGATRYCPPPPLPRGMG